MSLCSVNIQLRRNLQSNENKWRVQCTQKEFCMFSIARIVAELGTNEVRWICESSLGSMFH